MDASRDPPAASQSVQALLEVPGIGMELECERFANGAPHRPENFDGEMLDAIHLWREPEEAHQLLFRRFHVERFLDTVSRQIRDQVEIARAQLAPKLHGVHRIGERGPGGQVQQTRSRTAKEGFLKPLVS